METPESLYAEYDRLCVEAERLRRDAFKLKDAAAEAMKKARAMRKRAKEAAFERFAFEQDKALHGPFFALWCVRS